MNTNTASPVSLTVAGLGPVVGVRTTGIYCRPRCRTGRAPKRENCVPFADAEAARAAGYRACKQCRPDDPERTARRGAGHAAPATSQIGHAVGLSPFGYLFVARTERGICALYLLDDAEDPTGLERLRRDFPSAPFAADTDPAGLIELVVASLSGDAPGGGPALDLHGTPFQLRVWNALIEIPRGTTTSYGDLARTLGLTEGAARAVGTACGANRVTLLVPCHRVIRAGGGLGGYYWGLDRKRAILDSERSSLSPS